ncbi:MAG: D-glycero-beta-D-manno-heptose-7-phosphate kinase [Candidatus Sumerlaeia bacterium]|nr:D-glycero-beta-D-manno-heptose-7-phosphate kinase [Candidatus Sumerlaeia bacterium]
MNPSRLETILQGACGKRFLVVGDLMLDVYVHGRVERICPEAPVQVVLLQGERAMLGGCGNVARNLARYGVRVELCAVVGRDPQGQRVRELLAQDGVSGAGVFADPRRPTTTKTRITAERQQIIRLDREEKTFVEGRVEQRLTGYLARAIPRADIVLMSDYAKGVLSESVRRTVFLTARKAGIPVVVDPKLPDLRAYRGATVLKPNLREVEAACKRAIATQSELERAGRQLRRASGCEALVVTRGPLPTAVFQAGCKPVYVPTLAREVFDVSGAGDTMLAFIALGLAGGATLFEAVEMANLAAGIVVGKVGTACVEKSELLALFGEKER